MSDENCKDDSVQEELRLDQDVYIDLIKLYVRQNMLPESINVFNDYLSTGATLEEALASAVLNDMVNDALTMVVDDLTLADDLISQGEAIQARYKFYNKNNKEDNTDDNTTTEEVPR